MSQLVAIKADGTEVPINEAAMVELMNELETWADQFGANAGSDIDPSAKRVRDIAEQQRWVLIQSPRQDDELHKIEPTLSGLNLGNKRGRLADHGGNFALGLPGLVASLHQGRDSAFVGR
jgi:hypothetical protein